MTNNNPSQQPPVGVNENSTSDGAATGSALGSSTPPTRGFLVVGVGASAGGLEAFSQMLMHLPLDTGMAFVLVQHLDPGHESALVQILDRASTLPVREITEGLRVEPNQVYVIPRNTSLSIEGGVLKLQPRDGGRQPHKPIDAFFESLAHDQRERAVGVVLSGTANDGTLGLEAIRAEGGITFAQDDTAKHDSMPRSAIASGVVDLVLSPAGIAHELARIAKHPVITVSSPQKRMETDEDESGRDQGEENRAEATAHENDHTPLPSGGPPEVQQEPNIPSVNSRGKEMGSGVEEVEAADAGTRVAEEDYRKILLLLRNHSGVDFALYKSTTIRRRILRRVVITQSPSLGDYAQSLKGNAKELDALYSDVLISVTSFFRNPETFESLQASVLPALLTQRIDEPVRCWVLGCSTGQEAYSLAMAFVEVAERAAHMRQLQVFATDLNESLLEKARHGLYAKSLAEDISPQRLRRFFTEEQGGYRVSKSLREMVVFARQNLIADPPFSRMDLVSCRNLLIYLEPSLQKRAIPIFHYALRPGGFLLLGASESIGGFTELFEPVDKKHKIYAKKAAITPAFHLPRSRPHGMGAAQQVGSGIRALGLVKAGGTEPLDGLRGELNAQREADRIAITQFAPPGVLINAENQILQFRGPTGAYLQPPAGKASFDVLKMAREGLMIPLRAAIEEAKKENKAVRREGVRVQLDADGEEEGKTRTINIEVIPLRNVPERCMLVVFEETNRASRFLGQQPSRPALSRTEEANRIAELEAEVAANRDYLQATQEQQEATTEELQASNEEVQSANEELQSVNEELETSKEELESANEELTTVNDEMSHRNAELIRLNNDLVNLQTSTRLAILLVGRDLSVTRFSPQAEKQFDLLATDVGRPLGHIRQQLILASEGKPLDLEQIAKEVISSVREQEWEVRDKLGRWYSLRVRPYMTLDNRIDGAVLVLVDIDDLKKVEKVVEAARDYAQNTVSTVREPMLVLDKDLRVESANLAFYRVFGVNPKATMGRLVYDLGNGQWNIPGLRTVLETALMDGPVIEDFMVEHEFPGIGPRTMLLNARRMHDPQHQTVRILMAIEDITERLASEQMLRESEDARRLALEAAKAGTWSWNRDTGQVVWSKECYDLFGIDSDTDLLYDSWRNTLHPDDLERADNVARRAMERGEELHVEYRIRHPQRGERWLSSIGRIIDPVNRPGYMTGLVQDITERKRAEMDTAHLAAIVASSEDAIFSKDLNGIITSWNLGAENLLGYSGEEILGKPAAVLLPADLIDEEPNVLKRIRLGELIENHESVRLRKDGSRVDVSVTVSPLKNATGQVSGASIIAHDITQRKRTEERLRETESRLKEVVHAAHLSSDFRALFEASPTPFLVVTPPNYRIITANNAYLRATMTQREELLGRDLFEVFPDNPDEPGATGVGNLTASLQRVLTTRKPDTMPVQRYDMRRPLSKGGGFEVRYWSPINTPVLGVDGEVAAIIHRVEDVTEAVLKGGSDPREQLTRDQQGVIGRLREAVDQLTHNEAIIREQSDALAAESRRKDEFLAMLGHELRNPLAPIRSATHVLQLLASPGNEDPLQRQAREIIDRQVGNMTKLINDLLEVSRLVSGRIRLDLQHSDLKQLVRHAIETATPHIEQRRHTLTVHTGQNEVWVRADATRMEEVFINLLNNASKYTDEGGRIDIWCEQILGDRGQGLAQVRVRDNGVGIAPDLLLRIFDLFTQAERTLDRAQGGLGIGLTLAKRLVDLHGGSIEAKSPPDGATQGSEFIVRLPLSPPPVEVSLLKPVSDEQQVPKGVRVLVVDDNFDLATMLAFSLRQAGYLVQYADTGPKGLQIAQQWRPDLVLLDIGLPGMDGYEVARNIRAYQKLDSEGWVVRLIALTGYGRDSDWAMARQAGFDGYLVKPVEFKELQSMMKKLLSSHEM